MTYITEKNAKTKYCPIARTFHEGKKAVCDGGDCILWRWKVLPANDNRFLSAVIRKQHDLFEAAQKLNPDSKRKVAGYHKEAVAAVAAAPWDSIFMNEDDRGTCGLGGKP